jgi:hypothetical protein
MDRRTRDNQQPISAGRFHRQGAGHDHTNAYSDREPKCDTNGNCYTHCYRNRDGYTHRYCYCYCYRYCHCHCYSYRDRDSYSYGNRYTHCYCYCYAHCNCNRYSNANVDTDANTNSHSNRDAETYAHAAVSPFTKASSNSTSTVDFPAAGGSPREGPRTQDRRLRLVCPVSLRRSRREGHNKKKGSYAPPRRVLSDGPKPLSNTRVAFPLDLRHLTSNNIDLERSKSSYAARPSL